jgi:phosphomannomutase
MLEENLKEIKKMVLGRVADVGLCFDGDADRVVFIDEKGNTVSPDLIIALLAESFLKNGNETILYDLRCSNGIAEYIHERGGTAMMCPVGHTGIKRLLRDTGAVFGGELAGHYYFKNFFYSDSAWLTALLVLEVLDRSPKRLSEITREIQRYSFSGEINFEIDEKSNFFDELRRRYADGKKTDIDGLRIDYPDWWFVVRRSTNEPLARLVVEARDSRELETKVAEISAIINGEEYAC